MVFAKAKKVLDSKEADIKGEKWLAEVKDSSSGQWKDLDGWKTIYEPKKEKKEDSERKKAAKAKAKDKALDVAFDKMEQGMTKAFLKAMMEVSSTLLGKASHKTKEKEPVLSKMLSSTSAVILTYRFETSEKANKFAYIRKSACLDLMEILHALLADKEPKKISQDIHELIEQQKTTTRAALLQKIDAIVATADAKIDMSAQEVEGKVGEMKINAEGAMEVAKGIAGAENVEAAKAQAQAKGSEMIVALPDKDALKGQKDDVVAQFGSMFKELLLSKMEQLEYTLREYVDKFIAVVEAAEKMQQAKLSGAKKKSADDLKEELVILMDTQYKDAQERIATEVQKVLAMMRGMIANAQADEEETEE